MIYAKHPIQFSSYQMVQACGASNIEELRDCVNYFNVPMEEKRYEAELEELFLNEINE